MANTPDLVYREARCGLAPQPTEHLPRYLRIGRMRHGVV